MASTSIFPLTYLGHSVLQKSRDDELETIYELLLTQYLNFLRRVISDGKSMGETLSESFETVIIAIGNGQFTIRTSDTERHKDQLFRKHIEHRFTSDQLIYFNCYYFEVVSPMGRDERKCFAYFRRAIDARRCVPEDALVQLDSSISQWLLRNRHLARPPLLYCIVANKDPRTGLDCHVFLADNVQVGLRVVRCFAELRQTTDMSYHRSGLNVPQIEKRYQSPRRTRSRGPQTRRHLAERAGMNVYNSPRSRSNEPHLRKPLVTHCPGCLLTGDRNCYVNIRHEPRVCRSHTDLLHPWADQPHCPVCDVHYCAYCGEPLDSSTSTSDSEGKKRRLLQMKLGQEAMHYYERRKRMVDHAQAHHHPHHPHRERSVPPQVEQRLGRLNLSDHGMRSNKASNDLSGSRISSCPHHRSTGSAHSMGSRTFLDSSLSLLP